MENSVQNSDALISDVKLDLPALQPASKEEIRTATSSSQVSGDKNQLRVIGKISYLASKEIGLSGYGTTVYEGSYDIKRAAVKRILLSRDTDKLADQEIRNYLKAGDHQNVVTFYGKEKKDDFVYIALELCDCNLDDLISLASSEDPSEQYELVSKEELVSKDPISLTSFEDSSEQYELVSKEELVSKDHLHSRTTSVSLIHNVDRLEALKNKLGDVELWKENNGRLSPLLLKLMRDMVLGLVHLHTARLVHRDLKPQNVLIIKQDSTLCAKLTDMGISRILTGVKNTLTNHYSYCGTPGWKAKEWLRDRRQTLKTDLFSLGCLLFCCITRGRHPFGECYRREGNIMDGNVQNLSLIEKFPEAFHLISLLLQADDLSRPKAIEVLHHPLFWASEKRISFLSDASDRASDNSDLFQALESAAGKILGTERVFFRSVAQNWRTKVDDKIIKHIAPHAQFNNSIRDLLRLIKDLSNHDKPLPEDIQIFVGPPYERVDDYFTSRFPKLLIEVHKVVCEYCKGEDRFKKYFEGNLTGVDGN